MQRADPVARRRAVLWLVAIACLGAGALFALERWLAVTRDTQAAQAAFASALWYSATLAALPVVGLGGYAWRLAARVRASLRFPPPGQAVARDTPILEGRDAIRRATLLRLIAVLLVAAGASLLPWVQWVLERLGWGA